MAVTPYNYLNDAGVQKMADLLFRYGNTRIKERISTAIAAASYNDDNHVLSSKAILGLIGNISNWDIEQGQSGAIDPTAATVLSKVKALQLLIGTSSDTAEDNTVYGEIAEVRALISSLTHLTYEVVTGPITDVVDPSEDVIYLQHDADSKAIGNDNYYLNAQGTHAQYDDAGTVYEAWKDPSDGKNYKMVNGTKGAELASNDPIWNEVADVEDTTYNLYICQITPGTGGAEDIVEWICVGDTSIELSNYWSKNDTDVAALQSLILGNISDATIETKVAAAFAATDPYQAGGTGYLPAT